MEKIMLPRVSVVSSPITALPFDRQIELVLDWAKQRLSKVICVANVHMLMEAYWNQDFREILEEADLVTPDGMPLVWMMKRLGYRSQDRVAGMDILLSLCQSASDQNVSVFFVGSTHQVLAKISENLEQEFPYLQIAGMESLPFRPLTSSEDEALIHKINESGAGIVLVSLGCPKQEHWMSQHQGKVHAAMIGLGAVFPVYAGLHSRAPQWVRQAGLEWLYRLVQEPRRLWKRYVVTIPPFVWLALKQLVTQTNPQEHTRIRMKV
jgi:N-acetylglucosaminyldiphosphoundecaprenol N-acetyl-beta-D-mannosaminyltransferase